MWHEGNAAEPNGRRRWRPGPARPDGSGHYNANIPAASVAEQVRTRALIVCNKGASAVCARRENHMFAFLHHYHDAGSRFASIHLQRALCVANVEPLKPRRTIKAMSGGSKINGKLRVLCGNPAEMRGFPCDGQVRCQLWLNSPKSGREQGGWRNVIIFYPSSIHPSLSRVPPSLPLPLPPSLTPSSSSSHPPSPLIGLRSWITHRGSYL